MNCLETCTLDRECPNGMECDLTHEKNMWERLDMPTTIEEIKKFDGEGVKALKESLEYLIDSEEGHYQQWIECSWRDPETHIYHSATKALDWLNKRGDVR